MTIRYAAIAMVALAVACNGKDRGTMSGAVSTARGHADSALSEARGNADSALSEARRNADSALAGARSHADSALARVRRAARKGDSALRETASAPAPSTSVGAADTAAGGANPAESSFAMPGTGSPPSGAARFNLSSLSGDQVKELQTALNNDGCRAGPVDGIAGPRTQAGIACGMRKHNITGNDAKALYRALNLDIAG
jgi:hypothetical protein